MEIIDLKIAKEMIERYQATRKDLIDKTYGIDDTKSTWIPVAELEKFLTSLPPEATGVRIYLAAHGDTDTVSPKQTTVVVVGTVSDANGADIDNIISDALLAPAGLDPYNKTKDCPPMC